MKVKLDENLPESLVARLAALGHDVDTVRMEGFAGYVDAIVWQEAQLARRFFITQDLDFSDVRKFPPGTHCGIMLVRLPDAGRLELTERIGQVFAQKISLSPFCIWPSTWDMIGTALLLRFRRGDARGGSWKFGRLILAHLTWLVADEDTLCRIFRRL